MMPESLTPLITSKNRSIKQVMRIIDKAGLRIAFIIDKNKLIGSVTDGDIRRAILRGVTIDKPVKIIMNQDCLKVTNPWTPDLIFQIISDPQTKTLFGREAIKLPVINNHQQLIDLLIIHDYKISSWTETTKQKRRRYFRSKNILIIGGAGYIGSVLTRMLLRRGYRAIILDNLTYGLASIKDLQHHQHVTLIRGDTRNISDVVKAIRGSHAVIHLAELVGDPAAAINPITTLETNYLATHLIAETCRYLQVNRLIYMSSCSVYGATKDNRLLTENSHLNPVSIYAKMKIYSERALFELMDENFKPTILRSATVFGKSYRPRFDLVVNLLTGMAMTKGMITISGGNQWRPHIHVTDISRAIISAIEQPLDIVGGQVFNAGDNQLNCQISELGKIIKQKIPKAKIVPNHQTIDIRNYKVDFTKIKRQLKFQCQISIQEGIEEIQQLIKSGIIENYEDKIYSNVKFLSDQSQSIR